MATIKGPRGAMTKSLVTPYDVGDSVILMGLAGRDEDTFPTPPPPDGAMGIIRRIGISDPDDGDDAFLTFSVKFARCTLLLDDNEIAPATEANAWLLKQLSGLNVEKESAR